MQDLDTLTSTLEEDVEDGEMPFIDHVDRVCDRRLVGEQHRRPFLAQSTYRASDASSCSMVIYVALSPHQLTEERSTSSLW